jgi:CRISPR-associated endonuclease/helicase Cas3
LSQLLTADEREVIDARPRIVARPTAQLQPRARLVDLEHTRMDKTMLVQAPGAVPVIAGQRQRRAAITGTPSELNATSWWHLPPADALLTAVLPQQQPFRLDTVKRVDLELRPNADENGYELVRLMDKPNGRRGETLGVKVEDSQNHRIPDTDVQGHNIKLWGQTDYWESLTELATELDMTLADCARRFGTVTLAENDNGWRFHPALGFTKAKL